MASPHRSLGLRAFVLLPMVLLMMLLLAPTAVAQEEAESAEATPAAQQDESLIDQEPFDRIVLNEENENAVLVVLPLDLPGRTLPAELPKAGSLRASLVSNPEEELEVSWSGIARIELFEQMILRQAQKQISQRKFDQAFDTLAFLRDKYPKLPGLDATVDSMLYAEASALFAAKQLERAWLLLDEIYRRTPDRKGLPVALRRVLDAMFQAEMERSNYIEARRRYLLAESRYKGILPELIQDWKQRLTDVATRSKADVQAHLERQELRDAYVASRQMLQAWPDLPGARELAMDVARRYPLVRVGVEELARPVASKSPLLDWTSRRTNRLRFRQLSELGGVGPDGAIFQSPLGTFQASEDMRSVTLQLDAKEVSLIAGPAVAQQLLSMARESSSDYSPLWASLLDHIEPRDLSTVACFFRRPHLRPESLLAVPVGGTAVPTAWQPYELASATETEQIFRLQANYARKTDSQPREVIEREFATPPLAIGALRRGELELIDRVYPADVALLQREAEFQVVPYRVPSLHVLVANSQRTYPGNRLFRRAILYAINREQILQRELLGGHALPGCRVISGPFSPGISEDDPLAYGYDQRIEPRGYDARHARTLMQLAQIEIEAAAQKRKEKAESLGTLVLVHPRHQIARAACQEIVADLQVLGVACQLREVSAAEPLSNDEPWDFRYVDYVMPEPASGAAGLLSHEGAAACPSPHLQLALRQLEQVTSWSDVGERLRIVHQLVHDDTSILPLWQLVDHLVYRKGIEGLGAQPMSTYQAIEAWQITGVP